MASRAVGIDLGASTVWAVAAEGRRVVDGRVFGVDAGSLHQLRAWCGQATVAVDAPAGPSEGHHLDDATVGAKFRPARCAEVALGRAGWWVPWVTPVDGPFARWVEAGFAVYEALADLEPLEVYPHATFAVLLGARPPNKQTVAGREARLDALARARLTLPAAAALWSHDGLDAAAACVVAADHAGGRARRVACEDHGGGSAMWLPAAPRDPRRTQ